jgi:hypothetical protein
VIALVASGAVLALPALALAAPVPSPHPSGGIVDAWTCVDRMGPSPYPTTTPSPQGLGTTPMPTTVAVYGRLATDCAATSYGPFAPPAPAPSVAVDVSVPPAVLALPSCPADQASPTPSATDTASPTATPAPTVPQHGVDCPLLVGLDEPTRTPLLVLLGVLTMLALAGALYRWIRPLRLGS